MNRLSKWALAMVVGLSTIAPAFASPAGTWEIEYRDSRYDVTMCGDGTELCAKLIWLGNGADTEENLPYLNTFLIDQAKPDGEGRQNMTLGSVKLPSMRRLLDTRLHQTLRIW